MIFLLVFSISLIFFHLLEVNAILSFTYLMMDAVTSNCKAVTSLLNTSLSISLRFLSRLIEVINNL